MNDLRRVALITGGTNGIGKATALAFSKAGSIVTITGQTPEKCKFIATEIQTITGNPVDWIAADLSILSGIQSVATVFKQNNSKLNILINNAGAFFNQRIITEDGYEKTFALNHLNNFLLTHSLLDLLEESAPARIINVSSLAHAGIKRFDFGNLNGEKKYFGWNAYCLSKLCNILFTYELNRRILDHRITVNALHPGYVDTGFAKNNGPIFKLFISLGGILFAKKPSNGAQTIVDLALSPSLEGVSGKYFSDSVEWKSSPLSYDPFVASKLWQVSLEMTKIKPLLKG